MEVDALPAPPFSWRNDTDCYGDAAHMASVHPVARPMRTAVRSVEYMLYGLLLLQPILGLLYANAHGGRTGVFFVLRLPPLIQRNDELAEQLLLAHGAVATLLLAVIALHAAAALFHHFIRRDEILNRMLPKALQHSA